MRRDTRSVPDDIQLIRNGIRAWSRGDLEGTLANLHPDIEYIPSGLFPGVAGAYRGHDGFKEFWRDFRQAWERITFHIDHIVPGRPFHYAVVGRFEATGRQGIDVGRPIGNVFVVRDGSARRIASYATWEQTFDAAGVAAADRPSYR
jgi:ketosteroid isomerase-like protein